MNRSRAMPRREFLQLALGASGALAASMAAAPSALSRPAALPQCSTSSPAPAAQEKLTLRAVFLPDWGPNCEVIEQTGKQGALCTMIFPEFERTHPDITLEREPLIGSSDGRTKYLLQCRQGTQGDVHQLDGFWIAEFAAIGCTRPLDNLIPADLLADYYDPFVVRYNGQIHGLIPGTAFNSMLWYRKDWFEEAGLKEPPKDWNELKEYAKALTKVGANGEVERYGLYFPAIKGEAGTVILLGFYWQGEDTFVTPENRPAFVNQTSIDVFNSLAEIYHQGWAPPELVNMSGGDVDKAFYAEKAAMVLRWSGLQLDLARQEHLKDRVGLAPNPVYPRTGRRGTNAGGWGIGVTTRDDRLLQASWDLVALFSGGNKEYTKAQIQDIGFLPVWKSMADDPDFKKTEFDSVILSELPYAKTRPAVEIYPDASLQYIQAFQEVLVDRKDAEQALKDAADRTLKVAEEAGYLKS